MELKELFNPEEMQAIVLAEFEKFYAKSPFVGRGEDTKIAMNGAFYGGFNLAQERLIEKLKEYLPPKESLAE
jgi:transaldolase